LKFCQRIKFFKPRSGRIPCVAFFVGQFFRYRQPHLSEKKRLNFADCGWYTSFIASTRGKCRAWKKDNESWRYYETITVARRYAPAVVYRPGRICIAGDRFIRPG
jgi:hypothetical protein